MTLNGTIALFCVIKRNSVALGPIMWKWLTTVLKRCLLANNLRWGGGEREPSRGLLTTGA